MTYTEACRLAESIDGMVPDLFADSVTRYGIGSADWYATARQLGRKFPYQIRNEAELQALVKELKPRSSPAPIVPASEPARNGFLFAV